MLVTVLLFSYNFRPVALFLLLLIFTVTIWHFILLKEHIFITTTLLDTIIGA